MHLLSELVMISLTLASLHMVRGWCSSRTSTTSPNQGSPVLFVRGYFSLSWRRYSFRHLSQNWSNASLRLRTLAWNSCGLTSKSISPSLTVDSWAYDVQLTCKTVLMALLNHYWICRRVVLNWKLPQLLSMQWTIHRGSVLLSQWSSLNTFSWTVSYVCRSHPTMTFSSVKLHFTLRQVRYCCTSELVNNFFNCLSSRYEDFGIIRDHFQRVPLLAVNLLNDLRKV